MKKKRIKKIITWVVIVCVLGAAGGAGYWYFTKDDAVAAAQTFQQSRVTKGTITQGVSGSGSVAVSETEDAIVAEAGTVSAVNVEEGDVVKKGDVLATFEGEDVTLSLNKAKLSLQQQQMTLEQAQTKWKNLKISGGTEEEIASAEMSIKSAQLNIEQTQLEIQDYEEKAKAPDPIVAPIDGTVTNVDIKAGDEVQARLAAFTLVNYDKLEVTISADELDITKLKVGQEADVSIEALDGQEITGTVTEISKDGTSSNGVATFPVIVSLNEIENVLPGMSADVTVIIEQKTDALIVPVDAVESMGGRYFVRVPNDGTSSSSGGTTSAGSGTSSEGDGAAPSGAPADGAMPSGAPADGAMPSGAPVDGATSNDAPQGGQSGQSGTRGQGGFGGQSGGRQGGMAAMMNQSNGEFKMQEITVGITTDSQVEVLTGLSEGDTVLIPVVVNTSSTTTQMGGMMGGMGGMGGFGSTGGGFPGGGAGGFSGGGGGGGTTRASFGGGGGR
jgi:RND family efflux transporter, MFP subunit